MKTMNRIHQLAFDINFAATPADEQALPIWIQENLLPVIDQVMQQVNEQTERGSTQVRKIKRLEKLEIDLGTVSQTESATELQRRLHSQLFNALAFEFAEKNETSLQEQEASVQEAELIEFLRTGQLSWRSEQHGKHAQRHLLNQVLHQPLSTLESTLKSSTRFEKSLSQITQDELQLTRLVRQFDTPELFQIIKINLQNWSRQDQELILDWIGLELLSLSNLSAIPNVPAAVNASSKQQEKFWKHVLKASQQEQTWQSLIMSWLTQQQQTLEQALNYYHQAIETDATLSNSTRAALNLVLNNFNQQVSASRIDHAGYAQYEIAPTKDVVWSDAEVDALRELIIASRTDVHRLSTEDVLPTFNGDKRLHTGIDSNDNSAPKAIIHALKIADFEALAEQWPHLLIAQTKLIRTLQKSTWQLWLRNFKPVQCLEIACVLQTSCAWFISRHQLRILDLVPAERDHLLAQLLASEPDSLNVSDLLNSPHLASRFEIQAMQKLPEERDELHDKNIEAQKTSPTDDLHRLLKAWPALLQKPETLLTLFNRHKQTYLHSLPISHLLDLAQKAYPAIFQIWQPDRDLISSIEQHPKHESGLRRLLQSVFSTSPDALTPQSFIAMLSEQFEKNTSANFMLQWIKAETLTTSNQVSSPSSSENLPEQNLASPIQAKLDAAIESCLQINLSSLFTLRPALWRHWLAYAGEAQQLKLARQFQVQLGEFFLVLEHLPQAEKNAALASTLPLMLAALPGELKLTQMISGLAPNLQLSIKHKLSKTNAFKILVEGETASLASATPDVRLQSGEQMLDATAMSEKMLNQEMLSEAIDVHQQKASVSSLFFGKNSTYFRDLLPSLIQQRSQELAQFWRDLEQNQQAQLLTALHFENKVDLLALLYPDLSQRLYQSISLFKNALLSPTENASVNENTKNQSSGFVSTSSTDQQDILEIFSIAIDRLLVSDKHNTTSAQEIIKKFSGSVLTSLDDTQKEKLRKTQASPISSTNAKTNTETNTKANTEISASDPLSTIWSAHLTSNAEEVSSDSAQKSHLLNPLLHGFRSWQSGHVELSQLMLTIDELEQYLHWWILQQTRSDSESPPENYALMLNSIKKTAQECTHPELFMQLVLDALRDDVALDLEMFKTQAETMRTSNAKLHQKSNSSNASHALTSETENEDFLSKLGELSYDKNTIAQDFSLPFDSNPNLQGRAEFEQSHRIFIQQFFLALNDTQEMTALFAQLQRGPDLLNFLNTTQLHRLLIARLQTIDSGSQFGKINSDMSSNNEPHQLLSMLERQAYYSDASREFLLAVWHKLNEGAAISINKLQLLAKKLETAHSESLYEVPNIAALLHTQRSTKHKKNDRSNLKQALSRIFNAHRVTANNETETSITSNIARNSQADSALNLSSSKEIVGKSEKSSNQVLKKPRAKNENIFSQTESIQWLKNVQPYLQNKAFSIWTIEWLSAHAPSVHHDVFGYEIDDAAEPNQEDEGENTLLVPENFALILSVMHQALPPSLYQRWQRTAKEVFSLDEAFCEKLSQHPFPTSSELYQACSASLANSLVNTAWVDDQISGSLLKGESASEPKSAITSRPELPPTQEDRNAVSSLPPQLREALPHKLAQAMLDGHLQSLDLIWDEIRHHHADLLRQAQSRYLHNLSLREKIIVNNPVARLLDLVEALSQTASVCLKELWQVWDICRRYLHPTMDLTQCQKQSIRAAFSYLLSHPKSESRPDLFLENVLVHLLDSKIDAKFLPDLLGACLKDLNADQNSQSSQLLLAMYEIKQKNLLLENLHKVLDWHEPSLSTAAAQSTSSNEISIITRTIPILSKVQVQSLFVQEICMHAPHLIEDLFAHLVDEIHTEKSNEVFVDESTPTVNDTKLAKINASDYRLILNTTLHNSTKDAQEKFWHEYGQQLQLSAHASNVLQTQASALNQSLLSLFETNKKNQNQLIQKADSPSSEIQDASRQASITIEFETNHEDSQFKHAFSFDKLSLLLQTRRDLSVPEQKYLTLSLSRLQAVDKLAWANFSSALKDDFSLARYLQLAKLHDLDRLFSLLRPELATSLKDIIKRIEIVFDVTLSMSATVLMPATWCAIYRAEFIGAQAHHYQDFLIKLFSELAHTLIHTLPTPDICLQRLNAYKPDAREDHSNAENDDTIAVTSNEIERIKKDTSRVEKNKTNSSDNSELLNHESHVLNAGMVIVAPYAQRLFDILELTQNGRFVSDEAAQRAVHLLQYVVTSETHTPEFQLSLNKLLCGIHGGIPIVAGIEITAHEREVIEQMLNGVITHWRALGNTSIQGLRETFLRRQGYLYFEEDSWKLKIPQGGFDMLLDQLPWSFAMIKFPWMREPLHVTWR